MRPARTQGFSRYSFVALPIRSATNSSCENSRIHIWIQSGFRGEFRDAFRDEFGDDFRVEFRDEFRVEFRD